MEQEIENTKSRQVWVLFARGAEKLDVFTGNRNLFPRLVSDYNFIDLASVKKK
jgi:hypothetical protein